MTQFREVPHSKNYVMETVFPEASLATLTTIGVVSDRGLTETDAINQVISSHKWVSAIRAAGGLLLRRTDTNHA